MPATPPAHVQPNSYTGDDLITQFNRGRLAGSPRVSVILPTHNRPALLSDALASLEAQRYPDWEVIVIDDASTPHVDLDELVRLHPRLRAVRHDSPHGGAASKNSGLAAAQGEILAFLDDDDLYDPVYLARSVAILDRYPAIDVLFMGVAWFGSAAAYGERTHSESLARTLAEARPTTLEPGLLLFGDNLLPALLRRVSMPFQRPVVRRAALEQIGSYRSDCLLWDCEWALRAAMVARCGLLHEPLYRQRADGQGLSSRPDRQRDHLESGLETALRLYRNPPFPISDTTRSLFRHAASRGAADLAYYHSQRGEVGACVRAWWMSERIQPSVSRLKLPLGAIARAMGIVRGP